MLLFEQEALVFEWRVFFAEPGVVEVVVEKGPYVVEAVFGYVVGVGIVWIVCIRVCVEISWFLWFVGFGLQI